MIIQFAVLSSAFGFTEGELLVVNKDSPVPLYNSEDLKHLPYYAGKYGISCRNLMTVLLPGTFLRFISENKDGVCKVAWLADQEKSYEGYVHRQFLEQQCTQVQKNVVRWRHSPMALV